LTRRRGVLEARLSGYQNSAKSALALTGGVQRLWASIGNVSIIGLMPNRTVKSEVQHLGILAVSPRALSGRRRSIFAAVQVGPAENSLGSDNPKGAGAREPLFQN